MYRDEKTRLQRLILVIELFANVLVFRLSSEHELLKDEKVLHVYYYSCRPLHMDEQRQDDQLEPTYSSSVPIWDVALKTCQEQWTIGRGGEWGSGISMLMVWCDDDDDICNTYIHHWDESKFQWFASFFCFIKLNN